MGCHRGLVANFSVARYIFFLKELLNCIPDQRSMCHVTVEKIRIRPQKARLKRPWPRHANGQNKITVVKISFFKFSERKN